MDDSNNNGLPSNGFRNANILGFVQLTPEQLRRQALELSKKASGMTQEEIDRTVTAEIYKK